MIRIGLLFALIAFAPSPSFKGEELILNGSFENGLDSWRGLNMSGSFEFKKDKKERKAGKASLKMTRGSGQRVDFVKQSVPLPNDRGEVRFSAAYKVDDPGQLRVDVYFIDDEDKTIGANLNVFDSGKTKRKWKAAKKKFKVPEGAVKFGVNVRMSKEGTAWLDAVSAIWDGPKGDAKAEPASGLSNGGFESGLDGWTELDGGSGNARAVIDKRQQSEGKASLRLERRGPRLWPPDSWEARVERNGRAKSGSLRAAVRCDGDARASVTLLALSGEGALLESVRAVWRQPEEGADEFHTQTLALDLPRGTAEIAVVVSIEGAGKAWFDDLQWEAR